LISGGWLPEPPMSLVPETQKLYAWFGRPVIITAKSLFRVTATSVFASIVSLSWPIVTEYWLVMVLPV
jgi:hypothetical protein